MICTTIYGPQAHFSELGGKMDAQVKEQVAGMATLRNKLDQLLLGDHEQACYTFTLMKHEHEMLAPDCYVVAQAQTRALEMAVCPPTIA